MTVEDIDGGLHTAVDGQSLDEDEVRTDESDLICSRCYFCYCKGV